MGFDELFGNRQAQHTLKGYLKNNIIPFSMIFLGPGSANMLSFAIAFAKGINCLNMQGDFCGKCNNCVEIDKEIFMDLKILEPDGQFYKKEQISFLIEDNYKKPLKGKRKINILKQAHKMNETAANAFLKVLEEPAPLNVFILLTDNQRALLPTINSRCLTLKFSPLSSQEIETHLIENGWEAPKAHLISYLGSNMENALNTDYNELMEKREKTLSTLSSLITQHGMESVVLDLFHLSKSREKFLKSFTESVNLIELMLRDIMILKIDPGSNCVINIDFQEKLTNLCRFITIEKILFLIQKMEYLLRDIHRNLNIKVLIMEFISSYNENEVPHV
ncbi:MAG: ATP-binding protein [Candidatus Omnitrophota bacterium]